MKIIKITLIVFVLILIVGGVWFVFGSSDDLPEKEPPEDNSDQSVLEELTFEQKVGQRFIIGFQGTTVTPALESKMKELHPGGVLLLKRNIKDKQQLKDLTNKLQQIALEDTGLPLLIAVDQEGGSWCRIDWLNCTAPAEIDSAIKAFEVGQQRGKELQQLGVNLNLAPVLDESSEGDFIHSRTFQSEEAGSLGRSIIQGQQHHVLSVLKHFPGYTGIDFNPERDKLAELETIPQIYQFKTAMEAQPSMVMVANVIYNEINSDLPLPQTSEGIEFIRNELSAGLIISDDLSSPVLKEEYGLEQVIKNTSTAGIDLLLVAGFDEIEDTERAINYLKQQANQQNLEESLSKIIKLKENLPTHEKNN